MLKGRWSQGFRAWCEGIKSSLDDRARRTSHSKLFLWRISLSVCALLFLLGLGSANSFWSSSAPVSVHLESRIQAITLLYLKNDLLPGWSELDAKIQNVDGYPGTWCESGKFTFLERSEVPGKTELILTAQRVNLSDIPGWKMIAQLNAMPLESLNRIGKFSCSNDKPLPPTFIISLLLEAPEERDWVAALPGRLQPSGPTTANAEGAESFQRPAAFLQSGSVRTEVKSFPFGTGKVEKSATLSPGDQLKFDQEASKGGYETPVAYLTLQRNEGAIDLNARTVAERISVIRYGDPEANPLELAPPLWERFQAQEEWILLLAIFLLIQSVFTAWGHYAEQVWPESNDDN